MPIRYIDALPFRPAFPAAVRTRSVTAPSDGGTNRPVTVAKPVEVAVTREEYEALLARVNALEAQLTANAANTVNTVSSVNPVNANDVNARKVYMREYMARRRAAKKALTD